MNVVPQLTLEYTANLKNEIDLSGLFSRIHQLLNQVAGIDRKNCKSRLLRQEQFFIRDQIPENAFVHLEIHWFKGRSNEIKSQLAKALIALLKSFF